MKTIKLETLFLLHILFSVQDSDWKKKKKGFSALLFVWQRVSCTRRDRNMYGFWSFLLELAYVISSPVLLVGGIHMEKPDHGGG